MNNMKIWDAVKQPPPEALREIQAGRLKGKTDINPQWRYQVMTEQFGICGEGWKYDVEVWNEPTTADQVFAFAKVNLYVKVDDKWGDPIPGIGGSMLVTKESAGLHVSMLGIGANVYAGLSDSKYSPKAQPQATSATTQQPTGHWCSDHNTVFFKKGKMKGYAHPIGDTGEWCNEEQAPLDLEQAEKDIKDYWEKDIKDYWEGNEKAEPVVVETEAEAGKTPRPTRDPSTILMKQDLLEACVSDFGMKPDQITKELKAAFPDGLPGTFGECYEKIVELRCGKLNKEE